MPRPYLFGAFIACIAGACGSEDRGITQPTPSSAPPPSVVYFVHNTLNRPDNRTSRRLLISANLIPTPGPSQFVPLRVYDDFTSGVTTAIRTVSWQGGYCGGSPALGPLGAGGWCGLRGLTLGRGSLRPGVDKFLTRDRAIAIFVGPRDQLPEPLAPLLRHFIKHDFAVAVGVQPIKQPPAPRTTRPIGTIGRRRGFLL